MANNRYDQIIETIFLDHYREGEEVVAFERAELEDVALRLGFESVKNLGDVVYSYKYRNELPQAIRDKAPPNKEWIVRNTGKGKYAFEVRRMARILPDDQLTYAKILDATPGIVSKHALDDEQALLTKLRYNRLIDTFTGVTCYSLQNHLRTTVPDIGQVETDEIYVGVDKKGEQYVFPVQAKGGNDELGVVQIEQDIALCENKYPDLTCRAIAAQFMPDDIIALFEFEILDGEVRKAAERHYKLVPPDDLTLEEIRHYRTRPDNP